MGKKNSISILGCGWLGLPLTQECLQTGMVVRGSATARVKADEQKALGISSYVIHLNEPETLNQLPEFLNSHYLVIAIPPRARTQGNYPEQIAAVVPFIEQSSVKKVLFISSTSVYPNTNGEVTEICQGMPDSTSGKMLIEVEQMLLQNINFDTTVLRMAGLCGYDRQPGRFLAGKKQVPNGSGPVNLIHRDDCLSIIMEIMRQNKWNEVFNCCSDIHPTRREFYTKAAMGLQLEPPGFLETDTPAFKIISNTKLKKVLNYQFKYPDPMMMI